MNQSNKGALLTSTTRLSASAKPFTLNRSNHQPGSSHEPSGYSLDHPSSDPFGSLLDSYPKFNLGAKDYPLVSVPSGDCESTFTVETATQTQEKPLLQHPSVEFFGNSDLDHVLNESYLDIFKEFSVPVYTPNNTGLGYGTCNGNELSYGKQGGDSNESLLGKGNDCSSSAALVSIVEKDKHAVDGLSPFPKAYDGSTHTFVAKDILSNSTEMQAAAESSSFMMSNCEVAPFMFSESDRSSAAKLKDTIPARSSCPLSVVTLINCVSSDTSDRQSFSNGLSCFSNVVSDSTRNHPASTHGLSNACSAPLHLYSSGNMDFLTGSCVTDDGKSCCDFNASDTKDSFVTLNADGIKIYGGKSSIDEPKEMKMCTSVSIDGTYCSQMADCSFRANSIDIPNEVLLESHSTIVGNSVETSSKKLGDSDSDLDSPCWRGNRTMTFGQSLPEISGSVHLQHFEKEIGKCNSLNPLAPQFFPSNAEGSKYHGGEFESSKSSAPLTVNLLSGENRHMKPIVADSHPLELKKGSGLQYSSNMYGKEKAFNLLNDPKSMPRESKLNSPCTTQSGSIEDCSPLKRSPVTTVDVEGCIKGAKVAMASGSIIGSFPAKGQSSNPSSSSSQVVVTDLSKTLQGVSKSLTESPKLDVQIMVNAIHVLSELLVQACAPGLDSFNEHDHDLIQQIIKNLNVFSANYSGQRIPTLESTYTDSPYCLGRSSELPKHSNEGVEIKNVETMAVPQRLYHQNDNERQTSFSKVIAERGKCSFSSSDVGTEKGNDIVQLQVIRRNLGKSQDVEEYMHPQALLYRNLWLDSEAARCFMRYKTYLWLMEAGIDVNRSNCADFWR